MFQALARLPHHIARHGGLGVAPRVLPEATSRSLFTFSKPTGGVFATTPLTPQECSDGLNRCRQQRSLGGAPAGFWGHGTKTITSIDCHAAGEPARIIVAGAPEVKGVTMMEKRVQLMEVLHAN